VKSKNFFLTLNLFFTEEQSKSDRPLIGYFSASSEITGTLNEDLNLTALLHLFGAIAVWDYAASAPSVQIDMNPVVRGFAKQTIKCCDMAGKN
jgi:selenocysteine lyase/cysteine desulfurase